MDRVERKIWLSEIIVRKLIAEETLSQDESEQLREWLESSEKNKEFYERMFLQKELRDYEDIVSLYDQERGWREVNVRLRPVRKMRRRLWTGVAASVAFVLAAGVWLYWAKEPEPRQEVTVRISQIEPGKRQAVLHLASGEQIRLEEKDTTLLTGYSDIRVDKGQIEYGVRETDTAEVYNMITVPRGGVYSLVLSDGSTVYLNSESALRYPVKFQGGTRKVQLQGEAYFDVAADASRPFVVQSGNMRVRVLGTQFNVSAYPESMEYQTTLVEGKVEVGVRGMKGSRILQPGTQAVWDKKEGRMFVRGVAAEALAQWRDGIIVMNGEKLDNVMRALCRWYDVRYEYQDSLKENYTFTGRINRNEYLNDVLKTLTLMGGPQFEIRDSVIYIKNRK